MLLCLSLSLCVITGCNDNNKTYSEDTIVDNKVELTPYSQEKADIENGLQSYLKITPQVKRIPDYNPKSSVDGNNEWENISAITFDGVTINGLKTKVFAYIGYPEGASEDSKVPAMVLVHGGGGHAYAEWIKKWTDKGYAAIAFDNTGYFPSEAGKGIAGREEDPEAFWDYGLMGDFLEEGYTDAPKDSSMNDVGMPINEQWMFNAIAQTILAHNILRSDEKVISDKIGITGVSWGGVITALTIGYDTRWAFAIPIYGSGYLDEALSYLGISFMSPESKALWLAQDRFNKINFPVLWMGWNTDIAFSYNSNSKSYLDTKNNPKTVLSMINGLGHSHRAAWNSETSYRYADWIVNDGNGFAEFQKEPETREISMNFIKPNDAENVSAKIFYIKEKMTYSITGVTESSMDQQWMLAPCNVMDNKITATIPDEAYSYYVELIVATPNGSYTTTSSLVTIELE